MMTFGIRIRIRIHIRIQCNVFLFCNKQTTNRTDIYNQFHKTKQRSISDCNLNDSKHSIQSRS